MSLNKCILCEEIPYYSYNTTTTKGTKTHPVYITYQKTKEGHRKIHTMYFCSMDCVEYIEKIFKEEFYFSSFDKTNFLYPYDNYK